MAFKRPANNPNRGGGRPGRDRLKDALYMILLATIIVIVYILASRVACADPGGDCCLDSRDCHARLTACENLPPCPVAAPCPPCPKCPPAPACPRCPPAPEPQVIRERVEVPVEVERPGPPRYRNALGLAPAALLLDGEEFYGGRAWYSRTFGRADRWAWTTGATYLDFDIPTASIERCVDKGGWYCLAWGERDDEAWVVDTGIAVRFGPRR